MPAKILFKYTSRSRVDNFFRGLNSIYDNLANKEDFFVLCSFDVDDPAYANIPFVKRLEGYKNLQYYFGISDCKIQAINRDLAFAPEFDILVNFSDDQIFLMNGFDDLIRSDMAECCNDYDYFLHYTDHNVKHLLPTMSVMGVNYFKRFNYIYHESYRNVYSDNETIDVAKILGKHKFIDIEIFDHIHPAFGRCPNDEQYLKTEEKTGYERDRINYMARKERNFDL